jgi:hypothetical protein
MGAGEHQRHAPAMLQRVPQGVQESRPPAGVQRALEALVLIQAQQYAHLLWHGLLHAISQGTPP